MGIPHFFGWLIKNKNIDNLILNNISIKCDYLFIDANGIFYSCAYYIIEKYKNNELKIDKSKLIRKQIDKYIINAIIEYISNLINITKSTKYNYISIDSVVCFSKILQQRSRRYKYVYDNKNTDLEKNELLIPSLEFTPGSQFMKILHKYLNKKFSQKNNIIYSSYLEIGEGEHKIIQYIKKNTNINDKIIIYGLDADLLFLSLSVVNRTNKIYVMRESTEFKHIFNKNNENNENNENNKIKYNYVDIDQLKIMILNMGLTINDFILICFLIGNDFIPKILTIDVKRGGLDKIINAYNIIKKQTNKEFVTNNTINHDMLILLFKQLEFTEKNIWVNINRKNNDNLNRIKFSSSLEYYNHYFGTNWISINETEISLMVRNYIETFNWCIDYYLDECKSWKHSYNYKIAPLILDIIKYYPQNSQYELSKNQLKPIEQLLLVIPQKAYKYVMSDELINKIKNIKELGYLFPENYDLDINKEHVDWKFFVKIPIPNFDEYYSIISKYNLK